jgi:hypothetical protein
MTRTISTSVETLGYYVILPPHIEDMFGSHFENLERPEQYTLLATLSLYMAEHAWSDNSDYGLYSAYTEVSGRLSDQVRDILYELQKLEQQSEGTLLALTEALVLNIHHTQVVS